VCKYWHAGRLQVLWTDYDYALLYTCMSSVNGPCPRDQARVVVYARARRNYNNTDAVAGGWHLPDYVRQQLEPVANDACLDLEDFVPATLPPG